jgi:hypothetical protein
MIFSDARSMVLAPSVLVYRATTDRRPLGPSSVKDRKIWPFSLNFG